MHLRILLLISMLVGVSGCIADGDSTPEPEAPESDPGAPSVDAPQATPPPRRESGEFQGLIPSLTPVIDDQFALGDDRHGFLIVEFWVKQGGAPVFGPLHAEMTFTAPSGRIYTREYAIFYGIGTGPDGIVSTVILDEPPADLYSVRVDMTRESSVTEVTVKWCTTESSPERQVAPCS